MGREQMVMGKADFGSVRKLPSGNFQARYKIRGVEYKAPVTFPTKTMAKQWLSTEQARILKQIVAGEPTDAVLPKKKLPPFGVFAMEWLSSLEENGYSPDTARTYVSRWNAHMKDFFGKMDPRDVTRESIIAWDKSRPWKSMDVRRNAHRTLSVLLIWMAEQEVIRPLEMPRFNLRKKTRIPVAKVITVDEIEKIREAMPAYLRIAIDLGAWCSLRFGEVVGLERGDVDLESGTITLSRSAHRGVGGHRSVGKMKTANAYRVINMPPAMIPRMAEHLATHCGKLKTAPIVHAPKNREARISENSLRTKFIEAYKAVGIEHLRFHDLRHTGLTLAGQTGATLAELMARGGHRDVQVAMWYQHAQGERDKAIAERLGG